MVLYMSVFRDILTFEREIGERRSKIYRHLIQTYHVHIIGFDIFQ